MTKFRSHTVRSSHCFFVAATHTSRCPDVVQVAAQQHQGSLTEYYDLLLAHEPPPPTEPSHNPTLNVSLHRLNRALQAALHSIGGEVPEETPTTPEDADANAEADDAHQPPASPMSEPRPLQTVSDQLDTEPPVIQPTHPHMATGQHSEPEPEPQTQPSPLEPSSTNSSSAVSATATSTATADDDGASAGA